MLRQHFRIILILCLISSLGRFVLDSYLPSLPEIGGYFLISDSFSQLTLTLYLFGFSFSQLIYGPLSDYYGRRIIIMAGLGIFLLGSFICSLAISPEMLIISRLIAGIGAGSCGVLNRAIAHDYFRGAEFSKAWSYTTTSLVLTLIIAPVLGGYIQEQLGWRANFGLATLSIIAVLVIIFKFLPETNTNRLTGQLHFSDILKTYYRILKTRTFLMHTLCYTLAFSGLIAYFQLGSLLFIHGFGLTPLQYGWTSFVISGSYLAGGVLVNRLVSLLSIYHLLFLGAVIMLSGGLLMLAGHFLNVFHIIYVLLASAVYVIGARIVIPNAIAGSMEEFRQLGGSASALMGCIQMSGSALVSLLIANFTKQTLFPLALSLASLGVLCLLITYCTKPRISPVTLIATAI